MTSSIDWVHEIDASLDGLDQPPAYDAAHHFPQWHWRPRPTGQRFCDYVTERGPYIRRLAHAICCDWAQAETLVMDTVSRLYAGWHRFAEPGAADAFVHRALARAAVTDSPTPRSCNAHGDDYPIEDESLLFDGLQSLTAIQRKALVLHDWLDLPVDEVADAIGISAEEVSTHAARGRSALNFLLPASA